MPLRHTQVHHTRTHHINTPHTLTLSFALFSLSHSPTRSLTHSLTHFILFPPSLLPLPSFPLPPSSLLHFLAVEALWRSTPSGPPVTAKARARDRDSTCPPLVPRTTTCRCPQQWRAEGSTTHHDTYCQPPCQHKTLHHTTTHHTLSTTLPWQCTHPYQWFPQPSP